MRRAVILKTLRAVALGMVLASGIVIAPGARALAAPGCDALPAFAIAERYVANDLHRQALELIADSQAPDRGSRAAQLLQPLADAVDKLENTPGATPGRLAIAAADMAKLARIADPERYGADVDRILRMIFDTLLRDAADAVEVDYLVDLAATQATSVDEKLEAVRRHRMVAGDDVRQVSALLGLMRDHEDTGEGMAFARLMREIAPGTGNPRAAYSADGAYVRAVAAGAGDASARTIAAALLPVAKERLERTRAAVESGDLESADDRCFTDDKVVWAINEILKDSLSPAEMEANYEVEALEAVSFGELATDFVGASEIYFELLTLRAIDDAKYRDLMRYFALVNPEANGADAGEAGMAVSGAEIFESMLMPDLAREFLRDAKAWSADGAEPHMRFRTLLRSLRFEWKSGGTSRLDDDVAEARAILAAHGGEIDPVERIQFALFEAEFLDSRLDDGGATDALARAVDIALGEVEGPFGAQNVTMEFQGDISRLIVDHLRGRFCEGCDALMAPIVARFWSAAVLYDIDAIEGGMSDSGASKDMTAQLAATPGPVADALRGEIEAELDRLASFVSERIPRSSPARRVLDRLKPDERRTMLVAASLFPLQEGLIGDDDRWARTVLFLAERDLQKKRRALRPMVDGFAEHLSEFGADMSAFGQLESYGRVLADLRMPLSARVFFESVDRLAGPDHGIEYWNEPDAVGRRQLAKTLAPVYARLGRYAFEDKDWRATADRLDETSTLTTERLQQEWRAGNEQVALLYRAFQPALRLAAQLRFFLATNEKARKSVPDALERTFADLQSAMLGDTALAMQASIRNSIVRDSDLREAVERRDSARSRLAQMEATEAMVPSKLPWVIEARRAAAEREIAEASAVISERLAVSEDFAALAPATIDQATAVLAPDEALAILHAGSNNVFGFVLRPGRKPFLFVSKVEQAELSDRVARLRRDAASFGAVDMANSAALYDLLLEPAEAELVGIGHLVVIADGPLPGLPWAMLSTEASAARAGGGRAAEVRGAKPIAGGDDAGGADWAAQPFLIRRFPVSLAPSVSSLVAQRPGLATSQATKPFLGVGDPLLRGRRAAADIDISALYSRDGGLDAAALSDLAPLPETAAELTALAGSLGAGSADLLLGERATETELAGLSLSDYRVLAFATHGILAGEVGGTAEPGLVLSPESGAAGHDGYLSLSEIMSLRLDADLVILSACNTGGADGRPRAEWMSGLARGFIAAGARQLLVTLWSIPSEPTVRLTTGMTAAYAAEPGLGWSRALQRSIVAMLDSPASPIEAHPASWASFTVLGVDAIRR
jgi:CHAT domain-containing protein